jgi:8-oxo-dGTP pyrophosphatase MutT (NUDIX family)
MKLQSPNKTFMSTNVNEPRRDLIPAADNEPQKIYANGGDWIVVWHPPSETGLQGTPHGASGICLTSDDELVLVSDDESKWWLPGGRTEEGESWEQTLRREMLEEANAEVIEARLLGFIRAECLSGHEKGLVLVRSMWKASVVLADWNPQFEIPYRRVVPADEWVPNLYIDEGWEPIMHRMFVEAGLA